MTPVWKRWPVWVLLVFVVAGFLAVGATRDDGPRGPEERANSIAQRVACPVCDGESVFESRNAASVTIRNRISALVADGRASDDEVIADIETSFGGRVLLVPKATGFDALVWALPVAALICALAGLAVAFRRWRKEASTSAEPTTEDRAMVAAALADDDDHDDNSAS